MAVLFVLRSKESPLDPSRRLERSPLEIVEPLNKTRVARRETIFDDRFSFL